MPTIFQLSPLRRGDCLDFKCYSFLDEEDWDGKGDLITSPIFIGPIFHTESFQTLYVPAT